LNAAASGLSALPGIARPFACTQAMYRFLNNPRISLATLLEPCVEAVRDMLAEAPAADVGPASIGDEVVLVPLDWSMLHFGGHASKRDRHQRTHKTDLGYEVFCALAVDAGSGDPLGPLDLRLRTNDGVVSTRPDARVYEVRPDEILDVMRAVKAMGLGREAVHVADREADSVWHYRQWDAAGFSFLVRADDARMVRWNGRERRLPEIADALWTEPGATVDELVEPIDYRGARARLQVAEAAVVLARSARRTVAGKKRQIAGEPLSLRLAVGRLVAADDGRTLGRWLLLSNVAPRYDAATLVRWYYFRWRIESYFKLLKSAGQQVERWEQETGEAIARRLLIAGMACVTAWRLQRDLRPQAAEVRRVLIRLSGRQMKHEVESTPPALLLGLEKLLAALDLLEHYDLQELRRLAHSILPNLFNSS
jgi:hypothetical protein